MKESKFQQVDIFCYLWQVMQCLRVFQGAVSGNSMCYYKNSEDLVVRGVSLVMPLYHYNSTLNISLFLPPNDIRYHDFRPVKLLSTYRLEYMVSPNEREYSLFYQGSRSNEEYCPIAEGPTCRYNKSNMKLNDLNDQKTFFSIQT